MIEILSQTALATVQDLGRFGALRWGVGTAGAMDRMALVCGNLLLGNEEGAAAIEAQVFPFEVRFDVDCAFALTGADCAATLDGMPLPPWSAVKARTGAVLRLGLPASGRWRGARAYLCVAGGIDVPPVLGSRSTQLRGVIGGLEGRALRQGDRLKTAPPLPGSPHPLEIGLVPPSLAMPLQLDGCTAVRVLPAAEYDCFTPASREALWSASWKITPQSDRYGFRLAGPNLEPLAPIEMRSHGIVPGVIQVPHGGQPIVQMCDAQPSGGYPKVATVIEADLWRLSQTPICSRVRFIETDWDGALAAGDETRRWLAGVRRLLDLYRTRSHTR
jgi:5-oxoprolinase (ATP-hydrolysing) subunit C